MGELERRQPFEGQTEVIEPHHFYAAYIFDRANEREQDIRTVIEQAHGLGYPLRYWWLSDALEIQGHPNRFIICVHISLVSEDAGMDLYNILKEKGISWDELEAAAADEYRYLGKQALEIGDLVSPYGNLLFPHAKSEGESPTNENVVFAITTEDVREEAESRLGRELTEVEFSAVLAKFKKSLDWLDWAFYLDEIIRKCQEAGELGPYAEDKDGDF